MPRYLIDHAVKNVWCSPSQDNQLIFKPVRITADLGVLKYAKVMQRRVTLPDFENRYHIYYIGQFPPALANLLARDPTWSVEEWFTFTRAMNTYNVFATIYNEVGRQVPRFNSYFMFTNEKALIFAIPINKTLGIDLDNEDIYVRVYANAYYNSIRHDRDTTGIYTEGKIITSLNDVSTFRDKWLSYVNQPGSTMAMVNGIIVDSIDLYNTKVDDLVEFVYDASVCREVVFEAEELLTYESILDQVRKYLLHYPLTDDQNNIINFIDDIEVIIEHKNDLNRVYGFYYHRNKLDSLRNVTHRDFGIPVMYYRNIVIGLLEALYGSIYDLKDMRVRLWIRKSGFDRPLIFEDNRIFELYKLPDEKVMRAMVGVDSNLNLWKA
jgi:hypothetical protein